MSEIRNSSNYPVRLISYQIDKTKFGSDGGIIYPGECRYVNADNFSWDTAIISAFTKDGNPPGGVEVSWSGTGSLAGLSIGVSVTIAHAEAMAGMIMGKHDFVELYSVNNKAEFKLTSGAGGCRVNHGW